MRDEALRIRLGVFLRRARSKAGRELQRLGGRLVGPVPAPHAADGPVPQPPVEVPAPLTPPPTAPPVPDGWTEQEVRAVLESFSVDNTEPGALNGYVGEAFWRFLRTWDLVRAEQGTALELGAGPYFITWLLQEATELDLTLANYFGADDPTITQTLECTMPDGSRTRRELTSDLFNMEEDTFPYPDASFDVVLFCEILEHLLMDPLHALREIRRVLKPSGALVLTTPNVLRLDTVLTFAAGGNINDVYSGFGPYGRHNREYTRPEVHRLLEFAGFDIETSFTADAHLEVHEHRPELAVLRPLLQARPDDLAQYTFVKARPVRPPRPGLPTWLYRSYPPDQLVDA